MAHVSIELGAKVKLTKSLDKMIQERKEQIEVLHMEVEALEDARRLTLTEIETQERITKIKAIWG